MLTPRSSISSRFGRRALLRRPTIATCVFGLVASLTGASALASATPASASSLKPVNYQLGWITNTEFAGTYLAQQRGYFASGGIKVNLLPGGSNPVEPIVVSGKALVGDSNADIVSAAVAAGAPLRIIGARYQENPLCVISSAGNPIKNPKELIGKTIGVNTYNITALDIFLGENHISTSRVHIVDEGYTEGPTPLMNHRVDAWVGYSTNEPGVLQLAGFKNSFFLFSSFGYNVYADVYVTTINDIKTHRAQLVAFLKGEIAGWKYDLAHPAVGLTLTTKRYEKTLGFNPRQQALENIAQKALIENAYTKSHGLFTMSPSEIVRNIHTFEYAQAHSTTKYDTSKSLFDPSILQAALKG